MTTVTLSPQCHIGIPKAIRVSLGIQLGDKVHIIQCEDRIELIPLKDIR